MKKHITQSAIDAACKKWSELNVCMHTTSGHDHNRYLKGVIEFTECFAILTGQTWIDADHMLRNRCRKLDLSLSAPKGEKVE